jgi:4-amino-4-deoxy-L-arabinose transferase-like glycosyltransferase
LFYSAAVPLWEGYDEYSHFALIQYVATHTGRFPLGAVPPNSSRAVSESRRLTPGAWVIHNAGSGVLSYDEYFSLPAVEQNARRARLERLPLEWSREEAVPREPLYEAQQPPLYYWILAPFYGLMEGLSIPSIVWALRSLTALMASAAVPLVFFAGRRVLRSDAMALGAALVLASFPEMLIVIGHVSNEGLAVAAGAVFVLLALRLVERTPSPVSGLWLGIALGAALLTKAYFLALIPLAAVVVGYAWLRNPASRSTAAWQAVAALGSAMAISGWWYVHNLVVTGTLTGQFEDAQAMANGHVSLLGAVSGSHWAKVLDLVIVSHIWLGGWSFLVVRAWMYRIVELMMLAAIAGICAQVVRERSGLPWAKELGLLALPLLAMMAGLGFHAAQVFRVRGSAATVGYYLYALVMPESILLIAGMARLMPAKMRLLPVPIAVVVLTALEQFGAWFVLFPYYAGLIRHNSSGRLPTARMEQFWNGGAKTFFDHLSGIGPASSPSGVAVLAVLYVLATAVMLWLACRLLRKKSKVKSQRSKVKSD